MSSLQAEGRQEATQDVPRRIHLLGTGSIGILVAHSMGGLPNPPPMTLLAHNKENFDAWFARGEKLTLETDYNPEHRTGFDIELIGGDTLPIAHYTKSSIHPPGQGEDDIIHNLIVTVKACNTIAALRPIAHRLKPTSTIAFIQNGMGQIDEVNEQLFADVSRRPSYLFGVISHGSFVTAKWSAVHAGMGTLALGQLPKIPIGARKPEDSQSPAQSDEDHPPPSSPYLMKMITSPPVLSAVSFSHSDLIQLQLEKLATNCLLNPLTGLLDCNNGEILYNFSLTRVMRLLLAEISLVIRSLPELQGVPNVRMRFSPERLETLAVGMIGKTAKNISSMLADVRVGRQTEIGYINGYIVRRGEELGISCAMNYMIMHLILGKQRQVDRNLKGLLPVQMMEGGIDKEDV